MLFKGEAAYQELAYMKWFESFCMGEWGGVGGRDGLAGWITDLALTKLKSITYQDLSFLNFPDANIISKVMNYKTLKSLN